MRINHQKMSQSVSKMESECSCRLRFLGAEGPRRHCRYGINNTTRSCVINHNHVFFQKCVNVCPVTNFL